MSLADKLASKLNKLSHGTSGLIVRDSYRHAASTMIGVIALVIIAFFTIPFLFSNNTYATSSSVTITLDDNIVDLNVAPTANGAFSKSSASKIGVATTNYTGYTLSISASGNNNSGNSSGNGNNNNNPTALINGDKSLSSIETAITEEQFKALDSTAYNNQWGYLPSKYNSETNTSFLPSPSTNGDILDITSTANVVDSNTGNPIVNEYEITLGARVDSTASLGSYSNVFLVEAVANAIPYTIIFDDNVVGSMPTDINDETTGATITLPNNVPVRDGYTFLGWCTVVPTNTNGTDTCTGGTAYSASGTLTLDQEGGNNDYHLYAMWKEPTMQTFTASMCSAYASEEDYVLRDTRDGRAYTVRYINGGCWMTQNLRISGGTTLTPASSNVSVEYTIPTTDLSTGTSYTDGRVHDSGSNQIGVWYNYCAASAGTVCQNSMAQDAVYDICPAGWTLPSLNQFGSMRSVQLYSPVSGGYYDTSLQNAQLGYWWTKTAYNNSRSQYNKYYNIEGDFLENGTHYKDMGLFVRCILK